MYIASTPQIIMIIGYIGTFISIPITIIGIIHITKRIKKRKK